MKRLSLILLLVVAASAHKCIHDQTERYGNITDIEIPSSGTKTRAAKDFMRLKIVYQLDAGNVCKTKGDTVKLYSQVSYSCNDADVLTTDKEKFLKTVVDEASAFFSKTLKVTPLDSLTGGDKCPSTMASNDVGGPYTAFDTVLVVTALPIDTSGVLGFASTCTRIGTAGVDKGRPLTGYLNIAPAELSLDEYDKPYIKGIVIHEMLHALGFSRTTFDDAATLVEAKFPATVALAKKHFNCSTITEVPLEDNGGSGTAGSHFEKRSFMNEIMTGSSSFTPAISKFTLSVMQDLGFYDVDNSLAERYTYGANKGCDMVSSDCTKFPYKCEGETKGCSPDRTALGVCSSLDDLTGCPYVLPYTTKYCAGKPSALSTANMFGETYGVENSRCFEGTSMTLAVSSCFPVFCFADSYMVDIGGQFYECVSGGKLASTKYPGTYNCPDYAEMCTDRVEADVAKFPRINKISPTEGKAGTVVTIEGENLTDVVLTILEQCATTTIVNNTVATCTVTAINNIFSSVGQALTTKVVDVVAVSKDGKYNYVFPQSFTLKVEAAEVWTTFQGWAARNLFLTVVIISSAVAVVGLIVFGVYRLVFKKK